MEYTLVWIDRHADLLVVFHQNGMAAAAVVLIAVGRSIFVLIVTQTSTLAVLPVPLACVVAWVAALYPLAGRCFRIAAVADCPLAVFRPRNEHDWLLWEV